MKKRRKTLKVRASKSDEVVLDMTKPTRFIENDTLLLPAPTQPSHNWKVIALFVGVLTLVVGLSLALWWYIATFEKASGQPATAVISAVSDGWRSQPFSMTGTVSVLVLGLDAVENRGNSPLFTDTIILTVIHNDGRIQLVSIPRDLWIDPLKTKINALYTYGQESAEKNGSEIVRKVVTDISAVPIDYTLVISLDSVSQLIDALGGIDVTVQRSFTDTQYPRADVDISSKDPAVLYETVQFVQGKNHFDGETAVKFMRSRHSSDLTEGTDAARNIRQQEVFAAMVKKIMDQKVWAHPQLAGSLYRIWKSMVVTDISDANMVGIAKKLMGNHLELIPIPIPQSDKTQTGLIKENPRNSMGQWVYEPVDPSWKAFQDYLKSSLL